MQGKQLEWKNSVSLFFLTGFDNGVLGGVIDQPAFKATFNSPDATTVGLIVSLYEGRSA